MLPGGIMPICGIPPGAPPIGIMPGGAPSPGPAVIINWGSVRKKDQVMKNYIRFFISHMNIQTDGLSSHTHHHWRWLLLLLLLNSLSITLLELVNLCKSGEREVIFIYDRICKTTVHFCLGHYLVIACFSSENSEFIEQEGGSLPLPITATI